MPTGPPVRRVGANVAANVAAYEPRRRQSPVEHLGAEQRCDLGRFAASSVRQTPAERLELHDAQGVGGSNPLSPTTVDLRQWPQVDREPGE